MPSVEKVEFLTGRGYNARNWRNMGVEDIGPGVLGRDDFRVTFNAGLTVNVSPGVGYVRGKAKADQGMYRCYQSVVGGSMPVVLPAASANPRIDQIVLQVKDSAETPGGGNDAVVDVIQGTATAGTTLDSRAGAVDLTTIQNPNIIPLADVIINANNNPALSNASIRDRRPFCMHGSHPPIFTDVDIVSFQPPSNLHSGRVGINGNDHPSKQSACLMYLPRRIAATRVRFRYQQGATAVGTGQTFIIAIADASGRLIARTGATAFGGGSASQAFTPNPLFSPAMPAGFVFEPGLYWVIFGISAIGASSSAGFIGVSCDNIATSGYIANNPNMFARASANPGVTLPASGTILGFTDVVTDPYTGGNQGPVPVPIIALST